ncbi:hypothetical protein [Priestia megaterium]|uniref:hypothetical protein n=1 Tax=Priestia megaterium TaxID=1404 RepID=UPI000BF348D6|nr:hypothetical protein [Priestia megaterium]PFR88902.1 hypothetical protein COK39_25665 [Priestia megaterium]
MDKYVFVYVSNYMETEEDVRVFMSNRPEAAPIASITDVKKANKNRQSFVGCDDSLLIVQEGIFRLLDENVNEYTMLLDGEFNFEPDEEEFYSNCYLYRLDIPN